MSAKRVDWKLKKIGHDYHKDWFRFGHYHIWKSVPDGFTFKDLRNKNDISWAFRSFETVNDAVFAIQQLEESANK